MNQKFKDKIKFPSAYILFGMIFLSCASLIFLNYSTIRILSANRAYANGESQYSKAQKDAVRYLITYIHTKNYKYWNFYLREIKVINGAQLALNHLKINPDDEMVKIGLLAARDKEEDLNDIIWLFKNFNNTKSFAEAIAFWQEANDLSIDLIQIGNKVQKNINSKDFNEVQQNNLIQKIEIISEKFTIIERNFTEAMVRGFWKTKSYLIFANIFFIMIIISCVGFYFTSMMKKLLESAKVIKSQNDNLIIANKELDRFVYSASHDLRSPLTSLKGLVQIAKEENNIEQIKYYLDLMNQSLIKQDRFIIDIIDYSQNKRMEKTFEMINLNQLIDEIIEQHFDTYNSNDFILKRDIDIQEIYSDKLRLNIIFNNLISNAVKYFDPQKTENKIMIKVNKENNNCKIVVKDNGIGISDEIIPKIFDMFFGTNHNIGSGLGLYITMEAVKVLDGTITVNSKMNEGTIFTILLPLNYGNLC